MPSGVALLGEQQDFSGGMNVAVRPELIAPNGLAGSVNGVYDTVGAVSKRGGSSYRSTTAFGTLTFVWDGWLSSGQRTLLANTADFATVDSAGVVTNIGGSGLAAPGRAAAMQGVLYLPGGTTYDGATLATAAKTVPYYAVVANRLLAANGDRIDFSGIGTPGTFGATDFHRLPGGVQITGLEGLRDSAAVFTTDGIWLISNLALNLTDTNGNVQQRLDQYSRDVVLWGNAGIASWNGGLIVPAVDSVWQVQLGVKSELRAFSRLSDEIAPLYQDYVRRGYTPGLATVYRSHYMLPILNGTSVVDLLVCKLDAHDGQGRQTFPWSRFSGFGAGVTCLAQHRDSATSKPTLMGTSPGGWLLNLSYLEPGTLATDADGSSFPFDVLLRGFATGRLNKNTVKKLRVGYQLSSSGSASMQAYLLRGHAPPGASEWGLFDWGSGTWSSAAQEELLSGDAPLAPYGDAPYTWLLTARERFVQFRLRCGAAVTQCKLNSVEIFGRSNGRL